MVGVISQRDIVRVRSTDKAMRLDLDDLFRRVGNDWTVQVRDGSVTVTGPIQPRERAVAEAAAGR